jgi:hypothetical protein
LENLALSFSVDDVKHQGEFLEKLVEPVNGFLILDLHNLYCQSHNFDIPLLGANSTNAQILNDTLKNDSLKVTVTKDDIINMPERSRRLVLQEKYSYGAAGEKKWVCMFCGMG